MPALAPTPKETSREHAPRAPVPLMVATSDVIDAALHQVDAGFAVFALARNAKVPITEHGFKNATTNPEWVKTQLTSPSAGNYGMVWPTDAERIVVALDLDNGDGATETWEDRLRALMDRLGWLPATKSTTTPSGGRHAFFTWPENVPVPPGDELFGFTVRWPGRGYLVGPGSSIDGRPYLQGDVDAIAELPATWVHAAVAEHPQRQAPTGLITIMPGGFVLPDVIRAGRRYAAVRDYVASRYNSGLDEAELWALVRTEVAPRFAEPKTEQELRADFDRAMAKITERLGPPRRQMRAEDAVAAVSPIRVTPLSEIATEAVPWLWHRYLPIGSVTLFDGNPGEGKSTIVADLIARLTQGGSWPDLEATPIDGPGTVLYVTKEDDPATQVRPRIEAAGGDVSRVLFVATDLLFPRDAGRFGELLESVRPRLVLLDPLMSYLEGRVKAISDNEVRSAIMTPLGELARATDCVMLVVRHFNKTPGASALNRGAGSLGGLAGAARMVLALAPDPEDDDDRTRVFGVIKSNYEAKPPSLKVIIESAPVEGFQMTVSRASWQGKSATSVGDLMEHSREEHQQLLDAKEELSRILREAGEPMPSKDATAAMKARKFSQATIHRARAALRVHVERSGFPSSTYWSLPVISLILDETTDDSHQSSHANTTETTGERVQSSQSSSDETTGEESPHAGAPAGAGSSLNETTEMSEMDSGDSVQSSQSSHGVGLHAGAPTHEGSQGEWFRPCRDYEAHRDQHRRTEAGWVCGACDPEDAA